ncbi:MAG: two-component regulator propeller domain-containing protein [bacterium]|nr:two-component regulator propeller domain-containing protein [bacterium]
MVKTIKIKILIGLALLLVGAPETNSQTGLWQNLTSFSEIRRLRLIDGNLYAATSGGIQIISSHLKKPETILNTDGIGTVDIYDLVQDGSGSVWVAGNGRLAKIEGKSVQSYLILDRDNNPLPLYCLVNDGEFIWLGSDVGLLLFSKNDDGGQIQDSYLLFDSLAADPAVYDILLENDSLWIATSAGLAVAPRSDLTQLKAPESWKGFYFENDRHRGLGNDTVTSVVKSGNSVYAATPRAIVRVDLVADTIISVNADSLFQAKVRSINDTVYYFRKRASNADFGLIDSDSLKPLSVQLDTQTPVEGASFLGQFWLGTESDGLFYTDGDEYVPFSFMGLPGVSNTDIATRSNGELIAGFSNRVAGIMSDSVWNSNLFFRVSSSVMADSAGGAYIGTAGDGIWRIDIKQRPHYDRSNSTLIGNNDDTSFFFIDIKGLENNGRYLYAACYRAATGYPVAIADLTDLNDRANWDSLGAEDGLNDIYVSCLALDENRVAVGTEQNGLYLCDMGDDPFDHSQRLCTLYTSDFDAGDLVSNTIRSVKFDPEGNLWVGTNFGLSRWDVGFEKFVEVEMPAAAGTEISALQFDPRGNLYVGTAKGLARRDASTGEFELFTSRNSGLLSDHVSSLHFEVTTGLLYVGTDRGISARPSMTSNPTSDVTQVIAFPNPFLIGSGGNRLFFNYLKPAVVRLYSVAGELVRELPINSSWDGKNESGEDVSSGVYIFLVEDEDGNFGRGKVLLVRQ